MIKENELCDAPADGTDAEILEAIVIGRAIAKPANQVAGKIEAARAYAADALEGAASTLQEKSRTVSAASNIVRELGCAYGKDA